MLGAPSSGTPGTVDPSGDPNVIGSGQNTGGGPGGSFFLIMIVMMVGMLLLASMSGRKEKKKHAELVNNLQKKDKVRAAGGIIGTIIEVKNDELLLETDRASNTRIRVARGSVQSVLSTSGATESDDETIKD